MIDVEGLCFTYPCTNQQTLHSLDFQVEKGEVFGFLGPSGAGKSTAQKVLIGLMKNYQGKCQVLDKELKDWNSDLYEHIGVSFELPNHFEKLTAIENLSYFASLYQGKTFAPEEVLNWFGLKEDGHKRLSQFSKGMKCRLSVARSFIHDPEILFLDEPTTGLDPVNSQSVKELIKQQQAKGKTIFLTTHDMLVADELCDRVAFIVDGDIKVIDKPRDLKLRHGNASVRVEYLANDQVLNEEFPLQDLANNNVFFETLKKGAIQTIHTQEASLADIFIQVTGTSLS